MRLQTRIIVAIAVVLLVHVGVNFGIFRLTIWPRFNRFEQTYATKNLDRGRAALEREIFHLATLCRDWGAWDDTCEYVVDETGDFEEDNLNRRSFEENRLNLLHVYDTAGRLVWGRVRDLGRDAWVELPEFPPEGLPADHLLQAHGDAGGTISGIVRTGHGPLMIASSPIVTSQYEGPIRGSMMMGRFIDADVVAEISEQVEMPVRIWRLDDPDLPTRQAAAAATLAGRDGDVDIEAERDLLHVFGLLHALDGEPVLLMEADLPREIMAEGRRAQSLALRSTVVAGVVLLVILLILLRRLVVGPLVGLTDRIVEIRGSEDWLAKVALDRRDEIGTLSCGFEALLRVVARNNAELDASVSRLQGEVEERRKTERSLRRSEEVFRALADNSPDVIMRFDTAGRILYVNPTVESLTGIPAATFRTSTYRDLGVDPDQVEKWEETIGKVFASCEKQRLELRLPSGTWVDCQIVPGNTSEGMVDGIVAVARDISGHKDIERNLLQAKEMAEEASALKSRFVFNVSHEIRTPLNGIIGFTDAILQADDVDTARGHARIVQRESEVLLAYVNDLLDLAKIEAGKMDLDVRPVDLRCVMEEMVGNAWLTAREKGLEVSLTFPGDGPLFVMADSLRLQQVMRNLISNAVKFTREGSVRIVIEELERLDETTTLRFSVIDTGIGIPADKQDRIFESFTQADAGTSRSYGGTGLGTTIARQLVELMGGRIGLESEPGRGSNFHVTVTFDVAPEIAEADRPEAAACPPDRQDLAGGRILVAEDYTTNQILARLHLTGGGHRVTIVGDGEEALAACREHSYDLILMDLQMPRMDGFEATRRIRSSAGANSETPILALTASAEAGTRTACLEAGMNDVVTKPFRKRALLAVVARWLVRGRADREAELAIVAAVEPVPAGGSDLPLDRDLAQEQFGGDRKLALQMVAQLLKLAAVQRTEMSAALAGGDVETVRREAHKIKGGAASVAALPLSAAAARMEEAARDGRQDELPRMMDELAAELERLQTFLHAPSAGG